MHGVTPEPAPHLRAAPASNSYNGGRQLDPTRQHIHDTFPMPPPAGVLRFIPGWLVMDKPTEAIDQYAERIERVASSETLVWMARSDHYEEATWVWLKKSATPPIPLYENTEANQRAEQAAIHNTVLDDARQARSATLRSLPPPQPPLTAKHKPMPQLHSDPRGTAHHRAPHAPAPPPQPPLGLSIRTTRPAREEHTPPRQGAHARSTSPNYETEEITPPPARGSDD